VLRSEHVLRIPLVLAAAMLTLGAHASKQPERSQGLSLATLAPTLSRGSADAIADIPWSENVVSSSTGETVDVSVSTSYPAADDIGRQWADFFAGLPHGPELKLLRAYVAPLEQVHTICGLNAVGCYGDDQLVLANEPASGFEPAEIARHEYGHHIAFNRLDTPWPAFDWGPKHWATAAGICARVRSDSAYPGDEFLLYKLNPGEAFAETYRFLVDTKLGQEQPSWSVVDNSFYPGQAELDAVEQDVAAPWAGPTTYVFRAQPRRGSVWEQRLSTPLDGTVRLGVTAPRGTDISVELLAADGRKVLASRGARSTIEARICGERSLIVRVRATRASARSVELRVSVP